MRSRLIKALNNRFCVKFMQLEIGLLTFNCTALTYQIMRRNEKEREGGPVDPD